MRLEQERILNRVFITISIIFILISSLFLFMTLPKSELETRWTLSFTGADELFQTGQAVDFQLFLEDELGAPIENANMKAVFDRPGTVHQIEKTFSRIEGGLYETEVIFSVPGTWIAMVEVNQKGRTYYNQILFDVGGTIAAQSNRDLNDLFHLKQPLPNDLERELNSIPVFNR
ncbi:FixH family protein [Alkalihalobacillus deserti]|uniref:FixH family protein n=1 Tax=Alkalihalobacillus deserti TaxID=2879466 RepID=UPI001D15B275|nr:FixH family protein [Alkalihalobacillus deserti]